MPKTRATLAKLTRPRLHAAVKRARLFKLLDQRERYPIIWVNGPPGAGKTTLVASYLETRNANTFWYQVDEGDLDPATFFHYLAELAKQSKSRKKTPLPVLSADYLPNLAGFTRRFFRDLFARLGAEAVLVLDNCQDAAGESFHVILREACEEIPQGAYLIAISRTTQPNELVRHSANQRVRDIGWDALQLTPSETRDIAKLSKEETQTLHNQCEGWVAGLVLLMANRFVARPNQEAQTLQTKEAVFAYFAGEVFSRSAPETRELLMRAALFPFTTVAMAVEITANPDAGRILNALYEKQYFIDRKIKGELTYQFHDLFREFLLKKLSDTYDPAALVPLRARAGQLLQQRGQIADAVQLFRQAGDWERVTGLILANAQSLVDQGRWQTVNECYVALPQDWLEKNPWLIYWRGCVQLPVDLAVAKALLERAYEGFSAQDDVAGQCFAALDLMDIVCLTGDSHRIFDRWIPVLEHMLQHESSFLTHAFLLRTWVCYLTLVHYRAKNGPLIERGQRWLLAQLESANLSTNQELEVALTALAVCYTLADVEVGRRMAHRLGKLLERDYLTPHTKLWSFVWIGVFHAADDQPQRAIEFNKRSIDEAHVQSRGVASAFGKAHMARVLCQLGRVGEADTCLAELGTEAQRDLERLTLHLAQAFRHLFNGDFHSSLKSLEFAHPLAIGLETHMQILEILLARAALLTIECRLDEACVALAIASKTLPTTPIRLCDALAQLVQADISLARGNKNAAFESLKSALQHACNPLKAAFLCWSHASLPHLLGLAFEQGIEVDSARGLVRRFNVPADSPSNELWPWPIKIWALGDLRIEIDGDAFLSKGKAQHKLLELLRVIISLGAQRVSVDDIGEWLWPDADGDVAAGNLRTSLHRLRKLLKHDDAIIVHDNKVSLNDKLCWLDIRAFEHLTLESNDGLTPELLEKAVRLYRAHLFEKESHAWVLPLRDRLRMRFRRAALNLTKAWEMNGNADKAEALYHQCLERDGSAEMIYRQLMLHLKTRGRHAEALDVYRRCEATLLNSLAARPSSETRLVYESLRDI